MSAGISAGRRLIGGHFPGLAVAAAVVAGLMSCTPSPPTGGRTTPPTQPSPSAAETAGALTDLVFAGYVSDTLTSANVVCQAGGQFFFDIVGKSSRGKSVILSGRITPYTGPGTYQIPGAGVLLSYGGVPFTGHPSAGASSGSVSIAASGRAGTINNMTLPIANPSQSGHVVVNGTFACS